MSLYLGEDVAALRVGDLPATRAYLGDTLVYELDPVTMTVEGTTFSPVLELRAGSTATVTWTDEAGTVLATGTTPTITLPDATPRTVRLLVSAPADVVTLNLGFHEGQDAGRESLPSSYRHPTQPVTSITNLQNLSGLRRFMAACTDGVTTPSSGYTGPLLGGHLSFAGMANLEYIECYHNQVSSVTLTGCTSLIRLCLEAVALSQPLDLNPVRHNLRDLRAAVQQGGTLTLTSLEGPMEQLWHFCTRDQTLTGLPDMSDLPHIEQLWVWNDDLSLSTLAPRNTITGLDSLIFYGNQIDTLDLSGATWIDAYGSVRADNCNIQTVNLAGSDPIRSLRITGNLLDQAEVDSILATAVGWGTSDGTLRVEGNAVPSASGLADAATLQSRGWTVSYDTPTAPTITTATLATLQAGAATSQTLQAAGDTPITWAVTAGELPDGLALDSAGVLSGTPTTEGPYDFTVTATNDAGTDTQQYTGTVQAESTADPTLLWSDDFERADAAGWANSGGWHPGTGETDTDVNIDGGGLRLSGPNRYRMFLHDAGGALPADFEVEIGWTNTVAGNRGSYWGVCARVDAQGGGVKAFAAASSLSSFRIGNASSWSDGTPTDITAALPATWTDVGPHSLRMRCEGGTITAFIDGVQVHQDVSSINSALAGGQVGFCGQPENRAWDYIRVYALEG